MKKNYLTLILIFAIIFITATFYPKPSSPSTPNVVNSPIPTPANKKSDYPKTIDLEFNHIKYTISWVLIQNPQSVNLIPNFSEKLTAFEVFKKENCSFLTNAGFYDKLDNPLGLFVTNGIQTGKEIGSSLVNGIFIVKNDNTPKIAETAEDEKDIKIALQSGPILISDRLPNSLKIIRDEPSRRVIVGLDESNRIFFLTIYLEESKYQGPNLQDLPKILVEFQKVSGLTMNSALNLDGGTASTFLAESLQLNELSHSGAFFCIKN
jgi:uncharacterized protein YigE (DUF2233 family)